jgi:BlaI family transcriptional regulator, penicillinase repressor
MSSYMTQRLPRPTDPELEILTVLWSIGPATVRDVYTVISRRRLAQYSTVLKFMQIMTEKGAGPPRRETARPRLRSRQAP